MRRNGIIDKTAKQEILFFEKEFEKIRKADVF